jgi:Formamidopyrimidine-DNA glycosylase
MPELPEVETIRCDLQKKIVGTKIVSVELKDKKIGEAKNFAKFLVGKKISAVERIGKLLILKISAAQYLLIHLKMTGQLVFEDREELIAGGHEFLKNSPLGRGGAASATGWVGGRPALSEVEGGVSLEEIGGKLPNKYTRFILNFSGDKKLFFNDTRRFGYVKLVDNNELAAIKTRFGIEPLQNNFTLANLKKVFANRRAPVKSILMDQQKISGIGNIYASEILFAARVKPTRMANSLTAQEITKIFQASKAILKNAIKHRGTTFSDYVDASGNKGGFSKLLKVYEREGDPCFGCSGKIKNIKIAGRSTYFCEKCQK